MNDVRRTQTLKDVRLVHNDVLDEESDVSDVEENLKKAMEEDV